MLPLGGKPMDGLRHRMLESAGEQQKSDADRSRKPAVVEHGAESRAGNARSNIHKQHSGIASTIEFEIVPRLVLAHRTGFTSATSAASAAAGETIATGLTGLDWRPGTEQVAEFSQIVLSRDVADAFAYIADLRTGGISLEAIYLDLLAPSARYLGDLWEEDLADFTAVTVGLWRLQQIVRDLGSSFVQESDQREQGRRLLLAPGMGEQHSFGLFMVGEFFRRAGWDVWAQGASTSDELVEIVRREWFAVIGLSVACESHLEGLASVILRLRRASRNRSVGIMVGGRAFSEHPEFVALVGADASAVDGRQACLQAESLLAMLARRC
jgi:MerR family transcriptional regulator, light-induced transcriptional regulator